MTVEYLPPGPTTPPSAPFIRPILSRLPVETPQEDPKILSQAPWAYSDKRLPSITEASKALHAALHNFRAITSDYAHQEYKDCFNWDELELPLDVEGEWYVVAFRSKRKPDADPAHIERLYAADRVSHETAIAEGGLLIYWYGIPNADYDNLATCIWQSQAEARAGVKSSDHMEAMKLTPIVYEYYYIQRYTLKKSLGKKSIEILDFEGQPQPPIRK